MQDFKATVYKAAEFMIRCLYPKRCPFCDKIIPLKYEYCSCTHRSSIKISDNFCRHCGHENSNCVCKKENTVQLPCVTGVYIYGGKVKADIHCLKFEGGKRLAEKLGIKMAERVANTYSDIDFDIVSFVPLSSASYKQRGYNQSELLAKQVGKMLFVKTEDLFYKTRETDKQHLLSGHERLLNVKDSVSLKADVDVKGKNILICDDVKTTGATLDQCVKALEKGGAAKICCICIALSDFSK